MRAKKVSLAGLVFVGVVALSGCSEVSDTIKQDETKMVSEIAQSTTTAIPSRPAELNGIVSSVEGNIVVVKNEIGREALSEEEQAKKQAERQKMTQEERQALRAQESANVETEDVELTIPVGTSLYKTSGMADGKVIATDLETIKKGAYLSIWENGDVIEAIKIKATN